MFVSFERAVEIGKNNPDKYSWEPEIYGQWADLMLVLAVCDHAAELGWADITLCVVAFSGTYPELVEISIEPAEFLWLKVGRDRIPLDSGLFTLNHPLYARLLEARWQLSAEAVEIARRE